VGGGVNTTVEFLGGPKDGERVARPGNPLDAPAVLYFEAIDPSKQQVPPAVVQLRYVLDLRHALPGAPAGVLAYRYDGVTS
jgi:hypothetical protein